MPTDNLDPSVDREGDMTECPVLPDLELHIGDDYAVLMRPGETTDTASICLDKGTALEFGTLFCAAPDLLAAAKLALSMEA